MAEKRIFSRLSDKLSCKYKYPLPKGERAGDAIVLDLSSGGLKMLSQKFLKAGGVLEGSIEFTSGNIKFEGEVIDSKPEWYVTDKGKELYCTSRIKFKEISLEDKHKIIQYVHKCKEERRKAQIAKKELK